MEPLKRRQLGYIRKVRARLHTTSQGLQGIHGVIEIVFLLDVVSRLPKQLSGAQHNRRFGAHDIFEQLARIGLKESSLI